MYGAFSTFMVDSLIAMDEKTLKILEYPKVLERLAAYAAFSASAELAHSLRPTPDLARAVQMQKRTSEARLLLSLISDFSVGGARDVRPLVEKAARSGVLMPPEFLDIKGTLSAGRDIARVFERRVEVLPQLAELAAQLNPPTGLIDAITQVITDQAKVHDHASVRLASIRKEVRIAHDRLLARLERYLSDPGTASLLQDALITQRGGRYVIPLQADFKGRIPAIIHDQSSSGATLFVEPLAVVELNNHWYELQLAERDEVQRILAELSQLVGSQAPQINKMVSILAEVDLALMCAKYAEDTNSVEALVEAYRKGTPDHPGCTLRLFQARHPLLPQQNVVPIDVTLDDSTFALVITGPNTGGKTVTLKTVGLLALMAQSGLHIPALSGSVLSIFSDIFADIGDEQSIEQSLSTFSSHITNIIRILKRAKSTTMVLLDELGAGTDPQDGAALAQGILSYLMQRRIPNLVATHFPELKYFAHVTPGTTNASMEFDLKTLRPTYRLVIGLPGKSNALLIAERLGLPLEIIETSRATLHPLEQRSEDLLEEILRQRELARQERQEAEKIHKSAAAVKKELQVQMEQIEEERREILDAARAEATAEMETVQRELEEVRQSLRSKRQSVQELKEVHSQLEELQEIVQEKSHAGSGEAKSGRSLQVGDRVRLRTLGMIGTILTVGDENVEVQAGALRVRAQIADLQPVSKSGQPILPEKKQPSTLANKSSISLIHPSPGMELDLRGMSSEDALERLASYLEDAYLAGLPMVRIIHGKGTGRLRQSVRNALAKSEHVTSWDQGVEGEGGEGVTIAHLAAEV